MSNPSYWSHSTPYSRWTLEELKKDVGMALGVSYTRLTSEETARLLREINAEIEEWRLQFGLVRGFGEAADVNLTWVVGDTRIEMPADFAELLPGGKLWIQDSSGENQNRLEIIDRGAYENSIFDGETPFADRDVPIGYLYGLSTNGRRILEVRPTPTTAVKIKGPYLAHQQKLVNNADYIEAPVPMQDGIKSGCIARACGMRNNVEAANGHWRDRRRVWELLLSSSGSERKRPARFVPFGFGEADYNDFDRVLI